MANTGLQSTVPRAASGGVRRRRRPAPPAGRRRRRGARVSFVEFTGPARLDRRTKRLTRRLKPGDIAIIDHRDIDRVSAEELVESGVRVVVNVSESQTGRFPNPGHPVVHGRLRSA